VRAVLARAREEIRAGTDPGDIAVLVDVNRKGGDVTRALSAATGT